MRHAATARASARRREVNRRLHTAPGRARLARIWITRATQRDLEACAMVTRRSWEPRDRGSTPVVLGETARRKPSHIKHVREVTV